MGDTQSTLCKVFTGENGSEGELQGYFQAEVPQQKKLGFNQGGMRAPSESWALISCAHVSKKGEIEWLEDPYLYFVLAQDIHHTPGCYTCSWHLGGHCPWPLGYQILK